MDIELLRNFLKSRAGSMTKRLIASYFTANALCPDESLKKCWEENFSARKDGILS